MLHVRIEKHRLEEFCLRNRISKLAVFGSAVREDFDECRSDIDLLVSFDEGHVPGLFRFAGMAGELEKIFNRNVDLVTFNSVHPLLRQEIFAEAEVQYEKAG